MVSVTGLLIALVSTLTNGSFSVLSKIEPVKSSGIKPDIFSLYMCLGVGLCSFFVLLFGYEFAFTWLGFISGFLLSLSCASAFMAIKIIGLGVGSGIWGGVAVVISFLFGEIFDSPVTNLPLAIFAIIILIISMLGIAHAGAMSDRQILEELTRNLMGNDALTLHSMENAELTLNLLENEDLRSRPPKLVGFCMAIVSGITGGLILSPKTYAPTEAQGLAYLPSFGIGTIVIAPIITSMPYLLSCKVPRFCLLQAGPLGLCSGLIWNVGNACAIIAISKIGYSIAYPIMQCGLFVAGVWGICLFGEISGAYRNLYWFSGGFLIVGAVMLGLSS